VFEGEKMSSKEILSTDINLKKYLPKVDGRTGDLLRHREKEKNEHLDWSTNGKKEVPEQNGRMEYTPDDYEDIIF